MLKRKRKHKFSTFHLKLILGGVPSLLLLFLIFRVFVHGASPPIYLVGCVESAGKQTLYNVNFGTSPLASPPCKTGDSAVAWNNYAAGQGLSLTGNQFSLAPNGVMTANIASNAVTQIQSVSNTGSFSSNSTTFVDVPGQSVTLTTTGGAVLAMFSGSHHMSPAGFTGYWQIVRDNSVILAANNYGFSTVDWTTITMFGVDTPSIGTHTYKLQWRVNSGSGTLIASEGVYTENFAAVEFKR